METPTDTARRILARAFNNKHNNMLNRHDDSESDISDNSDISSLNEDERRAECDWIKKRVDVLQKHLISETGLEKGDVLFIHLFPLEKAKGSSYEHELITEYPSLDLDYQEDYFEIMTGAMMFHNPGNRRINVSNTFKAEIIRVFNQIVDHFNNTRIINGIAEYIIRPERRNSPRRLIERVMAFVYSHCYY